MKDPIEVVREMWDAHAPGDGRASLETFHPDVEWDGRNIPDGVLARGRETVTRERGRSEAGVLMDERHAETYVVRDGLIIRRVGFSDPAEALPAVRSWKT